jgi:bidirectional [NiFe] hydrogenase diaphorase subunit
VTSEELENIATTKRTQEQAFATEVRVCIDTGCLSAHSDKIYEELVQVAKNTGADSTCRVKRVGCCGLCSAGPLVTVAPKGDLYQHVTVQDAPEIIAGAVKNEPVKRLMSPASTAFFGRQKKIVLENAGVIEPDNIEDYIAHGGYEMLLKVLAEYTPADVLDEVTQSGIRGRGGAGFPTGLKWTTVAKTSAARKFVICNGDEGDPGAFMDRGVMEADPHRIIEGMTIAAYAVGASEGFIYVRAEYPLAVKRLKAAIRDARHRGLLGKNICQTPFTFDIDLRLGAGAFVCGEETALIASVEGNRGQPRPRPPFPAMSGLWGFPTLINNVETLANIVPIIRNGGAWYASIGTEKSKGTKVFALTGKIANAGLIEVPMGITLREIIYEIGGGIPGGKKFKAVQTGGPSGGCIPEQFLDMPVDYDSLASVGSIMGSGGMIVMDETSCMVDVAKFFMEFCMTESCGKCIPCRVGTVQMHDLLKKTLDGRARAEDIALLEKMCDMVRSTSLCGLGQTSPNPVVSTLRYFRPEYEQLLVSNEQSQEAELVGASSNGKEKH